MYRPWSSCKRRVQRRQAPTRQDASQLLQHPQKAISCALSSDCRSARLFLSPALPRPARTLNLNLKPYLGSLAEAVLKKRGTCRLEFVDRFKVCGGETMMRAKLSKPSVPRPEYKASRRVGNGARQPRAQSAVCPAGQGRSCSSHMLCLFVIASNPRFTALEECVCRRPSVGAHALFVVFVCSCVLMGSCAIHRRVRWRRKS